MKILNILWGFSSGGIGKCFLAYDKMGTVNPDIAVHSVCIDIRGRRCDRELLRQNKIDTISVSGLADISWIKQVKDRIRKHNPDIIFCHGFNGPVIVWIVEKLYHISIPMVCTYHGNYHPPTTYKKLLAPLYNRVQTLVYRTSAACVITVEDNSKIYLAQKGVQKEKLVTVYNGIPDDTDTSRKQEKSSDGIVKLCILSRLDAIKGIDYLIKSLPLISLNVQTKFKLYIIGDGPEYGKLRALVHELGLEKTVIFKGYQRDIKQWLEETDIFLLPSLSECHSISLLEAMRSAKPIIATNVGGNPETIRDGIDGMIVPPKNSEAIAGALTELMMRPSLQFTFGENARKRFLDKFTETIMLKNLANTFKTVQ